MAPVVLALTIRRLVAGPHESFHDFLRSAWDPRTATLIIAVLFVAAVQIAGPWAYTDMLGQPLLLAYAWATMAASYASILLGVLYLRSLAGSRIKALRPDPPGYRLMQPSQRWSRMRPRIIGARTIQNPYE